jgi:hypothetical protein
VTSKGYLEQILEEARTTNRLLRALIEETRNPAPPPTKLAAKKTR